MKSIFSETNRIEFESITNELAELREEFKKGNMKIADFNEQVRKLFSKYCWSRKDYDMFIKNKSNQ
jgi:hypothetical protein